MLKAGRRSTDEARIQDLTAEVDRLHTKLAELHNTDVNALKRAHRTITEHIQALRLEAQAIWPLIKQVEEDLIISPEFVAKELSAVGIIAANTAALHKLIDISSIPNNQRFPLKVVLVGLAVAGYGWRLISGVIRRTVEVVRKQNAARRKLLSEWQTVLDRIEIMTALVEWQPNWEEEQQQQQQEPQLRSRKQGARAVGDGVGGSQHAGQKSQPQQAQYVEYAGDEAEPSAPALPEALLA